MLSNKSHSELLEILSLQQFRQVEIFRVVREGGEEFLEWKGWIFAFKNILIILILRFLLTANVGRFSGLYSQQFNMTL